MATCADCGYEAADVFKFCPECGARVDGRTREQRKVVTALFCDVAGSTALGESIDAEALRALLARSSLAELAARGCDGPLACGVARPRCAHSGCRPQRHRGFA